MFEQQQQLESIKNIMEKEKNEFMNYEVCKNIEILAFSEYIPLSEF